MVRTFGTFSWTAVEKSSDLCIKFLAFRVTWDCVRARESGFHY